MASELLEFGRETPCPACGIALEIRGLCRQSHPDLAPDPSDAGRPVEHLHVACPGCSWTGYMAVADRGGAPARSVEGAEWPPGRRGPSSE